MTCLPSFNCCPNPCSPCLDPCFTFCFPCWPCKPCPCPPPEKLAIPFCFPDLPKKVKKKRKKKTKSQKGTFIEDDQLEEEPPPVNPCKCCRCCVCMGPKPDQPCNEGIGQCCRMCQCRGCQSCSSPCSPAPCPPPPCPPAPQPKMCSCGKSHVATDNQICDESCKAAQMDTQQNRCEKCGHRKKAVTVDCNKLMPMPTPNFIDAAVSGLRKGPVCYACCRSTDMLKPQIPTKNTVKTCSGCGKAQKPKQLCAGCKFLDTI